MSKTPHLLNNIPVDMDISIEKTPFEPCNGFIKHISYDLQTWNDRKAYLIKLQNQGNGWDGFDAKATKDASVEKALSVMKHLPEFVEIPPKLMIDEDGDVTLTWGKEETGVMVFLTIDPETLSLHVMEGCITVYQMKEFPSTNGNDKHVSREVAKNIMRYLRCVSRKNCSRSGC